MNPDIVGCDVRNEITGIRCGLETVVTMDDGTSYCQYCAPEEIEDKRIAWAIRNFRRAGML